MEVDRLILALQDFSSSSDLDRNCIVNSLNPLLLCITAAELSGAVSVWGLTFREKLLLLKQTFLSIAIEEGKTWASACPATAYSQVTAPANLWTIHKQFVVKLRTPSVFQYYWKRDGLMWWRLGFCWYICSYGFQSSHLFAR